MDPPYGLVWPKVFLAIEPEWAEEPDLAAANKLVEQHLGLSKGTCEMELFAEGLRNKVYIADTGGTSHVLRLSLPLDPLKVAGEVGAMRFVRFHTNIPVPKVVAFDTTGDNVLRFPYILMERASGHDLVDGWQKLSLDLKRKIIIQLADFQSQLDRLNFIGIGTLRVSEGSEPSLARVTAHDYLRLPATPRNSLSIHGSSHHWLQGRLERFLVRLRHEEISDEDPADIAECEWYRKKQEAKATALLDFLPRMFPSDQEHETTNLTHADLHTGNILVDDDHNMTAVIDWEFQQTVLKFLAKGFPKLLQTLKRKREPNPADYDDGPDADGNNQQHADDGVSLYWEAREEYEGTLLREFYVAEMERQCPGWLDAYEKTKFHRLVEHEISVLEFNLIGCNIINRMQRYTGEGLYEGLGEPFAMEDKPCSDEMWDDYVPSWLKAEGAAGPEDGETTLIDHGVEETEPKKDESSRIPAQQQ